MKDIQAVVDQLPPESQRAYKKEFERKRASTLVAYVLWLFFGWHYIYTGRLTTQLLFWVTLGGCGVWWAIDFFRIPGMISDRNRDAATNALVFAKAMST